MDMRICSDDAFPSNVAQSLYHAAGSQDGIGVDYGIGTDMDGRVNLRRSVNEGGRMDSGLKYRFRVERLSNLGEGQVGVLTDQKICVTRLGRFGNQNGTGLRSTKSIAVFRLS